MAIGVRLFGPESKLPFRMASISKNFRRHIPTIATREIDDHEVSREQRKKTFTGNQAPTARGHAN